MRLDAFRQLEIDKMYRLGIRDEEYVMNATDCRVSCLAVRTRKPERKSWSCVRCGSASPERRHRKIVASLDTELQNAYDNGRFNAYRKRHAPLFVSVSCFPIGHTTVRVTTSASDAKMWSCVRSQRRDRVLGAGGNARRGQALRQPDALLSRVHGRILRRVRVRPGVRPRPARIAGTNRAPSRRSRRCSCAGRDGMELTGSSCRHGGLTTGERDRGRIWERTTVRS